MWENNPVKKVIEWKRAATVLNSYILFVAEVHSLKCLPDDAFNHVLWNAEWTHTHTHTQTQTHTHTHTHNTHTHRHTHIHNTYTHTPRTHARTQRTRSTPRTHARTHHPHTHHTHHTHTTKCYNAVTGTQTSFIPLAPTELHTNPIGSGDIVCMYVYSALLCELCWFLTSKSRGRHIKS